MADITLSKDVHPDPDLWFDDGNVVVEAGNTAFKLYRGMISRQSTVFRDILEGKEHGLSGVEASDNNTLIRLSDSASDIRMMFLGITDPNFFQGPPHKYKASIILSIARTSHKYGIAVLYQRSIAHLAITFPTELTEWDARHVSQATYLATQEPNEIPNELMHLVSTVVSIKAPWLLPAVLYTACCTPLSHLLHTPTWRDLPSMSEQTRSMFLIGHGAQRQMNSTAFELLGYLPDEQCSTYIACDGVCKRWIREGFVWTDGHPLGKLEARYEQYLKGLCSACRGKCLRINHGSRRVIWDKLPAVFQLGSWDKLCAKRDEYLFSVGSLQRISRGPSRSSTKDQSGHQVLDGQG